jgi:RIP metalloprotease RseP
VDTVPVVLHHEVSQPRGVRQPRDLQRCPACGTDNALSIVGSQAASLSSVAISHLYTSPLNDDKKLLVFTDSVQDASHRAAFYGARTYRFSTRTAFQALLESVHRTYYFTKLTVLSVVKLIQGTVSTKTLGGPIMIAEMAGQQAKEGAGNLVTFIALLSINLAILNILPIPVLDGGHLLFFTIEALTGRPVNLKVREVAQQAGIFLLMLLMILVFYNDITRIFFR